MPYQPLPGINTPKPLTLTELLAQAQGQPVTLQQILGGLQNEGGLAQRLRNMAPPVADAGPSTFPQTDQPRLANILNPGAVDNLLDNGPAPKSNNVFDKFFGMLGDVGSALANPPEPQVDPNQAMLEMLLSGAAAPSSPGFDVEAAMSSATEGVAKPFNAQIGLLKHQNKAAKAETESGRKEIQAMYRALARDQKRMGRKEMQRGRGVAQELQNLGAVGADKLGETTDQILNTNAAAASGLGSPDLLAALNPAISQQGERIAGNLIGEATNRAQGQLAHSDNDRRYFNRAAGSSKLEGVNRSADLLADLQDYLAQNRAQIGSIAGQRAQALASAKNSVLGALSQAQDDSAQQTFDNQMDVVQWWTGLQNAIADREAQGQQGPMENPYLSEGTSNALGLIGQDPELQNLFQSVIGTPEYYSKGYFRNNDKYNVPFQGNPAGVQQFLLSEFANQMPTDPQRLQALIDALSQYAPRSQMPSF